VRIVTSAPASFRHELIIAEPSGRYEPAQPVVVDCSVVAAALFHEAEGIPAWETLEGLDLNAPQLLPSEFVNVAVKKSRQGFESIARQGLADFLELEIVLHPVDPAAQWRIATELGISAYDAAYLCLAESLQAPLVTFDRRLGEAARRLLTGR
jgi:predicted nucleic acid-binding protein